MALIDMLDERATTYDPSETLDPNTRRPVTDLTPVDTDVPCAYVKRADTTTVFDDQGGVVTDADLILLGSATPPAPGWQVEVAGRGTLLVTGDPQQSRRRTTGQVVSYRIPVRYLDV